MDTFGVDLSDTMRETYGRAPHATDGSPDASLGSLSYWVVCGGRSHPSGPEEVLRVKEDASGAALAVFSFREEAEAFLAFRAGGQGLCIKKLDGGELISLLHGPWSGLSRVALDPVPEAECQALDGLVDDLVTVGRQEFVGLILSRLEPPLSGPAREVQCPVTDPDDPEEARMSDHLAGGEELAFSAPVGSVDGAPVVEVRGEVDLATVPRLLEAIGIAGARINGRPLAFVDLRHARFIDICGVRSLVQEAQAMRELGGELRLVIPEEGPVAHAFGILGVEEVLELHRELIPDDCWSG